MRAPSPCWRQRSCTSHARTDARTHASKHACMLRLACRRARGSAGEARKVRQAGVVEDAAHAADLHLLGTARAASAHLRLAVGAALLGVVLAPEEPDVAVLAPGGAPGVLNEVEELAKLLVLAICDKNHRVVDDRILGAAVEDAGVVHRPRPGGDGDAHGAALVDRSQQRLVPVLWQTLPALHAEGQALGARLREVDPGLRELLQREAAVAAFDHLHQTPVHERLLAGGVGTPVGGLALLGEATVQRPVERELDGGALAAARAAALVGVGHARDELLRAERLRAAWVVDLQVLLQHRDC
mmetsp:Transcript_123709/g.385231  ORF Transcript_123709/g.385231 Transcript_123709/m.385231 type:complete len:299 (+) Transcript_123709:70-966(+)